MKHITTFKLFEADGPVEPPSFWSWTKDLTIPRDIQEDIYDMAFELKDEGYTISYQWWPPYEQSSKFYKDNKYPSINITKTIQNEEGGLEKISYAWIKDFCERVSSYLDEKDYNVVVKFRKVNTNDYYDINKSYPNQEPFSDHHMPTSIHFRIEMISRRVYGNVFESSGMKSSYSEEDIKKTDEVIADLKDILLELSDIGYTTNVDYKVILSRRMITSHPQIQINITKPSEDSEMNAGFRFLPLWNTEDDKIEFDGVILRVLRYSVDEGYKYEYEGLKSGAESIRGQVVNYSITLYKD